MKKGPIFLIFLFFLVILVPQLCAQASSMSPEESLAARKKLVAYSKQFIGCPYLSGGIGPDAFDCSGLIFTCSRESIGIQLPRKTSAMFNFVTLIEDADREAGDLLFFKTVGNEISHVALYIGNKQFIHAASDGPNNGVIISSLNQDYWKKHYYKAGRFLPATKDPSVAKASSGSSTDRSAGTASSGSTAASGASRGDKSFLSQLVYDGGLSLDWNFFTAKDVRLNFRGLTASAHVMYTGSPLKPGVGSFMRWDSGTGTLQIPFVASLTLGNYTRIFAGPVLSLGSPTLPGDSDKKIKSSFFPGIMGVVWNTPSFKIANLDFCFTQDIHYTIFNKTNGAAQNLGDSLISGLVFSTGMRVTLPL